MPSKDGSSPVKMVNLVLTEKEAIASEMLYALGVAALVRETALVILIHRNIDRLFTFYFTDEEKNTFGKKMTHLCDAISKETMEAMNLKVAEWPT